MAGQALSLAARVVEATRGLLAETRRIRLAGDSEIEYRLRRAARRSFALQVDARGVTVAVPHAARLAEVEAFIGAHARWLLDKLAARAAAPAPVRFAPVDGACFPLFGTPCRLRILPGTRRARWQRAPDGVEELVLAPSADPAAALVRALRQRALGWFAERVAAYCQRLGQPVPPVRLTAARTRWGSCSQASGIRLHWRLIHLPPALGDYVVAHEVAHLLEMNHSPRFWAVVAFLYPDWQAARARLREAARDLPHIAPGAAGQPDHED